MSLKNKLNRYRQYLSANKENNKEIRHKVNDDNNVDSTKDSLHIPNREIWGKNNVQPFLFDGQYSLIKEKVYPIDYQHGNYKFSDVLAATEHWNKSSLNHPLSNKGIPISEMIFFDTETTGLGSGAGTYIFLLSYARVYEDRVILRQHLLPEPGNEVALYQGFLSEVGPSINLLTSYNGKSFDWPMLKSRHTLIREYVPKLPPFGHFDLYHAARRLWKNRLERLKLSIVEEEILGVKRKNDVPGYLAPMIYFDFVETKRIEGMLRVLEHNELDILSLITLYTHISKQLLNQMSNQSVQEVYEVGRWFASIGEAATAETTLLPIIEENCEEGEKAKFLLSMEWKKQKNWLHAVSLWEQLLLAQNDEIKVKSSIELAKYLEHKEKDFAKAYNIVKKASQIKNIQEKYIYDLEKRLFRLKQKLNKKSNTL